MNLLFYRDVFVALLMTIVIGYILVSIIIGTFFRRLSQLDVLDCLMFFRLKIYSVKVEFSNSDKIVNLKVKALSKIRAVEKSRSCLTIQDQADPEITYTFSS